MTKRAQSAALEGELTNVERGHWVIQVVDPQAQNPWLALKVFGSSKLALRIAARLTRPATVSPHRASGMIRVESPADAEGLMRVLRTDFASYQGRPINWQLGSPPEMTVCPTY